MNRFFFILFISFLLPTSAFAAAPASFSAARSLVTASTSPGNAYLAGLSVVTTAPIKGDLSAIAGDIISTAPINGDELLLVGSSDSRAEVAGDFRAIGGNITVEKPVAGDLVALGISVNDSGRTGGSVFVVALNAALSSGASGPVTIYANNVSLAGDFAGDVKVVASGRVTIDPNTVIHGALSYESPETAAIPTSASIIGGTTYTNISYLPNAGTSRALALASVEFFLIVRILSVIILAGLLAGLFPRLTEAIVERARTKRMRDILLTLLLGFALLVATPILLILLMLTFVGISIALIVFIAYALMVFLSFMFAGILLGGLFARRFMRRERIVWHDGVLGMLALSLVALVPFIGMFIMLLLTTFSAGALGLIFFNFAFPHEGQTAELV
jgi:hypothetical protein